MPAEPPTLAALLTPLAPGAIAVISLHGPRAGELLAAVLRRAKADAPPGLPLHRPTLCRVVDGGETLDEAIAVRLSDQPPIRAEIHTHGGVRVVQRVLALLERLGATIVPGGDFPRHSVGAVEREIDDALMKTPSRRVATWLLMQRSILPPFLANVERQPAEVIHAFRERSLVAIRLFAGLRVALIGPPNAGKSTLANRLIGSDKSITSEIPGTTRDWVSEIALIDGWPVTLIDTAGLRETTCEIETEAIRRSREQAAQADLILHVLDAAAGGTVSRSEAVAGGGAIPQIMVLNKCDLVSPVPPSQSHNSLHAACGVSALTGQGIDELEKLIKRMLGLDLLESDEPTAITEGQLAALPPIESKGA